MPAGETGTFTHSDARFDDVFNAVHDDDCVITDDDCLFTCPIPTQHGVTRFPRIQTL